MAGVWQLSMVEFSDFYMLRGVVLCNPLPDIDLNNSWFKSARYVIRTYFCKPLVQENILVNGTIPVQTDKHGAFELKMDKRDVLKGLQISYNSEILVI